MATATTGRIFKTYQSTFDGLPGYIAGLPSYPRNFSRDVIVAGIVSQDEDMLETQIKISAEHQGIQDNVLTGEEAGKIHHEFPGVTLRGRGNYLTTYDACDTTSLFLIAIEGLSKVSNYKYQQIITAYHRQIVLAVAYLLRHIENGIFYEHPPLAGSRFALKVTYWKDSIFPQASGREELEYPVAYALPHFMAARAILSASTMLGMEELTGVADEMFRRGIRQFIQTSKFVVARGEGLVFAQASSDELHCLAYIPSKFGRLLPLTAIQARARQLETPVGFACTPRAVADVLHDTYHGYVVWPFEQALIHYGCAKFGLKNCAACAARIAPCIGIGHELIEVLPEIKPAGNNRQLWSVAASVYFSKAPSLRLNPWL